MNKIISKFFFFLLLTSNERYSSDHHSSSRSHPTSTCAPIVHGRDTFFIYFLCLHACQYISFIVHSRHPKCHTRFQGSKTWARTSPNVLGSSLTHMMTHDIETNITSLIYNGVLYKIVK